MSSRAVWKPDPWVPSAVSAARDGTVRPSSRFHGGRGSRAGRALGQGRLPADRPGLRRAASRRPGLPAPASRSESGRRSYIWSHEGRSSSDSLSFPANVLQQRKSSRNSLESERRCRDCERWTSFRNPGHPVATLELVCAEARPPTPLPPPPAPRRLPGAVPAPHAQRHARRACAWLPSLPGLASLLPRANRVSGCRHLQLDENPRSQSGANT